MGSTPSNNQQSHKYYGPNYPLNGYYRFKQSRVSHTQLQMDASDFQSVSKLISSHCILGILGDQERTSIVRCFNKYQYDGGVYIYRQHDISTDLYLIKNGSVSVQIYCNIVKNLCEDNYFGHQSFCFNYPRGQSIRILTQHTILYVLQKEKVFHLIHNKMQIYRQDINNAFNRIHFFNYLNNKQRNFLIQNTFIFTLNPDETLFEKEQDSNSFYIVRKGTVTISIDKKKDIVMKQNDYFGESAFLSIIQSTKKRQRMGRAFASSQQVEVYAIGLNRVKNCIGNQIRSIVFFNLQKWALFRDQHLNSFPNVDFNYLLQLFNVKEGKKFNILAKKGSIPLYLYIPLDLQINFNHDPKLYCSEYLKQENQFKPLNQDILMTDEGCYAYALIKQFKEVLSINQNELKSYEFDMRLLSQPIYKNLTLTLRNVSKFSKKIPSSQYSHVLIVQDMKFGNQFIVKIYKKSQNRNSCNNVDSIQNISQSKIWKDSLNSFKFIKSKAFKPYQKNALASIDKIEENYLKSQKKIQKRILDESLIRREKNLLASLNSKFFCGFFKAQHDENNYYLFLEYIVGISLHQLIIQFGIVPQNIVKYVIASIATAIDYLHSNKIVYRNLNSVDIIITQKGNVVITDFSCAKLLGSEGKTNTLIGIPYYMAPEMIKNSEYTYNVDIWSMGIILYQLLTCTVPFGQKAESPVQIYEQILSKEVNFCKIGNKNAKILLQSLLEKDPSKRLTKSMEIRQYNFINDSEFDWSLFLADELSPIFFSRKTVFDYININNFDFFDASTIQDWS